MDLTRSNLASKFALVRDTRPVMDPWGIGIVFVLERSDSKEHLAWLREQNAKSPFQSKMSEVMARSTMLVAAGTAQGEPITREDVMSAAAAIIEKTEFNPEMLQGFRVDRVESVARRVKGISGLKTDAGDPIEYSDEAVRELLSSQMWVEKGLMYGDQTLGHALLEFLSTESDRHAEYRDVVVDDSGKGSAPTSGGATSTSEASTA